MLDDLSKDTYILDGFRSFDEDITKEYFYGYCRRAYAVFDYKYQLKNKAGLDFYSLAHEYYIQLLSHDFRQLEDRPKDMKLSTWMMGGFRFVVLDALKAYNKDFDNLVTTQSDAVLEYVRSTDHEEGMMYMVAEAVASHYHDRKMQEIAHMILYAGFKQKEVAEQLGMTPAAINQRYKKIMDEVVTPFIIEHYSKGIYYGAKGGIMAEDTNMEMSSPCMAPVFASMFKDTSVPEPFNKIMMNKRITPDYVTTLEENEIFVFGSNLQGIHAGGAARTACLNFGAVMGNGVGIQGKSYAIPTMQGDIETIKPYVDEFVAYALRHPELHFWVTPVGCGIAGFEPDDIAPLFEAAKEIENIALPESFWDVLAE